MKNVFLDTNVVIDLLQKRENFYENSAMIFSLGLEHKLKLFVSPITFSTASYILRKSGPEKIKIVLSGLRKLVDAVDTGNVEIDSSLKSQFDDLEDAMQYFCAQKCGAEVIITRNGKDFKASTIKVQSPDVFLKEFK